MTANEINKIRRSVKDKNPIIHCITNPISINECANAVLAVGARPIMAEHPEEVKEITAAAKSLVLNLGNITEARIKSVQISAKTAKENKIPTTLDVVGVCCSELRLGLANLLIKESCPTVIKGNYSEINSLLNPGYKSAGVDAEKLDVNIISGVALQLARINNAIILASGKTDIVTDGKRLIYIKNGSPQLVGVTGTGCMLGTLCGVYLSSYQDISAVVTACAVLGMCGELAQTDKGSGSFMVRLMDMLSVLTESDIESNLKVEERKIENI